MAALLALLIVWVVGSGGGGGKNGADGSNGKNPAQTITPGPSSSGPAISQHPGGRDESSGSGSGGSGDGAGGSGDGSGSGSGSASGAASGSGGGSGDGTKAGGGSADQLPAGSSVPNCAADAVKLTLHSVRNTYAPDEKPTLELVAKNTGGGDCKVDFGPKNAVVTITQAGGDDAYWSSDDCPTSAAAVLLRVPAGSQITYMLKWDRKPSAPECATPPAGSATAGTYLVEAKAPGLAKARASFVLEKD